MRICRRPDTRRSGLDVHRDAAPTQFVFYGGALALKPGAKRKELLDAMRRHVLAQGDLVCIFQKPAGAGGS